MPVTPVCVPSPNVGTHGYTTIVDAQGYVIGTIATSDGAQFGSISGESQFLFNNGGPVLFDGSPSQLSFERARSFLGKHRAAGTISSTLANDATIVFSLAPKTLMRGQAIRLSGSGIAEYVYVADTFIPSASVNTIPLQSPVVNSGQTTANWDEFHTGGPNGGLAQPTGIGVHAVALQAAGGDDTITFASNGIADGVAPREFPGMVLVKLTSSTTTERERLPNVFKPFNAQAVTISSANTPTAIWTPASGKKFRLMGYWFSTTVAAGLIFHDLASVGGGGVMPIPSPIGAAAGVLQCPPIGNGIVSAAANNKLWIDATVATTLTGFVFGMEE